MASGGEFNGMPPVPASSVASRATQLSVNAKKRLLDIEVKGKWRVYEREQSQKGRVLERQLATAEANLGDATALHNILIEEVQGQAFSDFTPEQQQRYRVSHADLAHLGGEVNRIRKELSALEEGTRDEKKRMEEELCDEKEKLEILQEIVEEQQLGSDDSTLAAVNRTRANIQQWINQNSTAAEATGIDTGRVGRSPNRNLEFATARRTSSPSENVGRTNYDHDDHGSQREGENTIGVNELVAALGSAFGGGSSLEKKLPPFGGCPGEWLNFRATFDRMNRPKKLEPSAMMRRLTEALKGEAKTAVQHLFSNPDNLPKVLEVLERRFGKAEFVLDYLVEKAKSCQAADMKNPKTIVDFGTAVEAPVENVKSYNKNDYLRDKSLQQQLVEKLPGQMKYKWHEHLLDNGNPDTDLQGFSSWLTKQVMIAEMQVKPTFVEVETKEKREPRKRNRGGIHAAAGEEEPKKCLHCDKPKHGVGTCYTFKKLPLEERQEFAKKKGLCFLCLEPNHMTTKCKSDKKCDVNGCGKKHHPLLHRKKRPEDDSNKAKQQNVDDTDEDTTPSAPSVENVIGAAASANNLAVIPVRVKGPSGTQKVYAMLDTGATFSMIEEGVAKKLGLKGTKEMLNYTVFGDRRSEDSLKTTVSVSSVMKNTEFHDIPTIHTVKKIGLPPRTFDAEEFKMKFPHLRKMKASSMNNAKPQMVIGINAGGLFAAREILEIKPGKMPAGIRSLLGWYVLNDEESVSKQFEFLCQCRKQEEEMSQMMKQFFSTESFGVVPANMEGRSKDDLRALQLLNENTKYDGQRWSSCLLWKNDDLTLPHSKNMAMKRLYSMERKMDKDPLFAKLCIEKFQDYESKGYLHERDGSGIHHRRWYLPWFFAIHPTKKPRLVFDAAAKVEGKSLNDFQLKGPDLLRPLPAVLIRFRKHLIGLTGDIKEMFHQVKLIEADKPSQTVLFRGMDRKASPKELEMTVLFFGSASSPCSAIFAKDKNEEAYKEKYPEAVKSSRMDIYMDDNLSGGDDSSAVIQLRKDLSEIHDRGGFLLTKWNSSSQEVLKSIPLELRSESTVSR